MECLIISGMSGAGKSLTVDVLEDVGFYCIDNMPVAMIPYFAELFPDSRYKRIAFVVDARGGLDSAELFSVMEEMRHIGVVFRILFIDASDDVLVNRQRESRRRHPLDWQGKGLVAAINEERQLLAPIRSRADFVIDTSYLTTAGLRSQLMNLFCERGQRITLTLCSFGFKYGLPRDSDMVFDVRFLRNPYYVSELREKTGQDEEVANYVMESPAAAEFVDRLYSLLDFLLARYIEEGRTSLVISIGCTGGRHRSVTIARKLAERLGEAGHAVSLRHRDIAKG